MTYPENQLSIVSMPAVAHVVGEEAPGESVVFVWHQNTDSVHAIRIAHVLLPNHRQEQGACRVHYCNVRQKPMLIVGLQRFNHPQEERMLGDSAHGIVRNPSWLCSANPCWVRKKGIETSLATLRSRLVKENWVQWWLHITRTSSKSRYVPP